MQDHVEQVGRPRELRRVDGSVGREAQLVALDPQDLCEVPQPEQRLGLEDVGLLVELELGRQHRPFLGGRALHHLHANHRRESSVAQLGLDQLEEVVRLVLVALGVRVPGDAEERHIDHLHAGEEQVEIGRDDVLHGQEALAVRQAQEARQAGAHRHLDARHVLLVLARVAQGDEQVEREVRDERERVRRIGGLRREQREHVLQEVLPDPCPLVLVDPDRGAHLDAVLAKLSVEGALHLGGARLEAAHPLVAGGDLLVRCPTVGGQALHARLALLLEAPDALHEELVEVRVHDRQEEHPLEQRVARVGGLAQHPVVEVEPGQLTVERVLGRGDVVFGPRDELLEGHEQLGRRGPYLLRSLRDQLLRTLAAAGRHATRRRPPAGVPDLTDRLPLVLAVGSVALRVHAFPLSPSAEGPASVSPRGPRSWRWEHGPGAPGARVLHKAAG